MPDPFQYQEEIVKAAAASPTRFLAVDTGLGKSRCVLEASKRVGASAVLVPCPAIGKVSWPAEVEKWWPEAACFVPPEPDLLTRHATRPTVAIVSYDDLARNGRKWLEAARRYNADVVAPDEAQYLKNLEAARTQVVYGERADRRGSLVEGARFVWPLSGTPAPNYTSELWTHLHALAPHTIGHPARYRALTEPEFRDRYSIQRASTHGLHVTGSTRTDELRARTSEFFYRLRKSDVLHDLPPILWTQEPIPYSAEAAARAAELAFTDETLLEALEGEHLATARRLLGLAKVPGAIEWANGFLAGSDRERKLILFAYHKEVVEQLARGLAHYGFAMIHGNTSMLSRIEAVKAFQRDPAVRVFVGQTNACGTSITLTAASDVAFVEGDWTPNNLVQAAARADRLGQSRGVVARLLYVPQSQDEIIARVAARKARELAVMFDHYHHGKGESCV